MELALLVLRTTLAVAGASPTVAVKLSEAGAKANPACAEAHTPLLHTSFAGQSVLEAHWPLGEPEPEQAITPLASAHTAAGLNQFLFIILTSRCCLPGWLSTRCETIGETALPLKGNQSV
jgi:hypothetical protein